MGRAPGLKCVRVMVIEDGGKLVKVQVAHSLSRFKERKAFFRNGRSDLAVAAGIDDALDPEGLGTPNSFPKQSMKSITWFWWLSRMLSSLLLS